MSPLSDLRAYILRVFTGSAATQTPVTIPTPHFRTDNDSSATLTLDDGRKLGYAEYGSPTGKAIFYMHGHPGSRLECAGFDDIGKEVGARIIAIDRPGMGWSSPHPGRKLLDMPKDVEQLAKHLKVDRYSVLGISGGGPYALACAAASPRDKLKCVSIVVGLGPPDIGMRGVDWMHILAYSGGYRLAPVWLTRWFWQRMPAGRPDLSPEQRLELGLRQPLVHEKDADFMTTDWVRLSQRSFRESFAQGFEAAAQEGALYCTDFGFRIEDIRPDLPVQLWYAKFDTYVPANHGVQIAARLRGRADLRVLDETHGSMVTNRAKEIFENLVKGT